MRIIALWLNPRSVGTHCVGHVGIVMLLKAVCCNGALVFFSIPTVFECILEARNCVRWVLDKVSLES